MGLTEVPRYHFFRNTVLLLGYLFSHELAESRIPTGAGKRRHLYNLLMFFVVSVHSFHFVVDKLLDHRTRFPQFNMYYL